MIAKSMTPFVRGSSEIRKMFEEGKKMAEIYGAENVYDFSVGNPGLHPPKEVYDAIDHINHDLDPHMVHGYMANAGHVSTRQTVADDLNKRFGTDYTIDNIIMTVGAGSAINALMKTIYDPGDKQIVFAPYFVEYDNWAGNYYAESIVVRSNEANGFEPDPEDLKKALTPDVKAVIINNPNNPTGVIYSEETIIGLTNVLKEAEREFGHPVYIISDEPYRELVYTDQEVPFIPNYYDNTLIAYSWSKSLSLPGERIGYLAISPKSDDPEEFFGAAVVASRVSGATNAPSLQQLIIDECIDAQVDISYYKKNAEDLYKIVTDAGFTALKPQGAFYMWVKSPVADEHEFIDALKQERILGVAGSAFAGPGYIRLSFCISHETIMNSAESFKKAGNKYFK